MASIIHHTYYCMKAGARSAPAMTRVNTARIPSFHCFCYKVFYYSNFKDFNTIAPAC